MAAIKTTSEDRECSIFRLTIRFGRRYLADYPKEYVAWMWVAIALIEEARYEEAERALAKAIEFCPPEKRLLPLAQMGHSFLSEGDYDHAAEWYQKAIDADPLNAGRYIHLGGLRAKQGRFYDAEAVLRAGIKCDEGCIEEAYLALGYVLRSVEQFKEAAECFREPIRIDPEYREAKRALRDIEMCISMDRK